MPNPRIITNLSTSNYLSFDGTNENLTMIGGNVKLTPSFSASLGAGNYWTHSKGKDKNEPAIEAKLKYNIGEHLNAQARFREIGGTEQYRVTFGGSYKIDKHQSIYASAHATAKNSNEWKYNTGGWIGYTYNFNNGVSVSGELQQNIPLNKGSKNVGKTLGCFDDSNKMVNVMITVPLK